jgi:hypothetical protein
MSEKHAGWAGRGKSSSGGSCSGQAVVAVDTPVSYLPQRLICCSSSSRAFLARDADPPS